MLRSRRLLRHAAPLALICLLAACADNGREPLLSQVQPIDIPPADTTTRTNVNISNPTLQIPTTYPVADGDLLTLVWSDEFDAAQLDPEIWFFESGDGSQYGIPGWGNDELQWYLPDNARLENGLLIIEARRETVGQFGYTSARITTQDRFAFQYGRIEARMKLPAGQGLWPAFWMLPQDDEQGSAPAEGVYGGFSASGEIDIMEAVNLGGNPGPAGLGGGNEIFGTIHFGGEFPANQFTTVEYTPSESLTTGFNTFAVEWDEFEIRWYVNGILFAAQNAWNSSAAPYPAPFDQPFKILLNLAVGGSLPGSPDGSAPFPSTMEVDWVRVYSGEAPGGGMPTEPAASAPTPGEDPADVTSLFSDSYVDIMGVDFNPDNGQATVFSSAQISGNQMLKYAGLDFQIIDFSANPQDVSDKGFLHVDVWTADSTELNISLISPGPAQSSANSIAVAANSWVSVDIPLTDFEGADLGNVTQLRFDGNGTIFVDNLYFAGDAPITAPTVSAPTPTQDAADVMSLFSDAYADASSTWPTPWSVPNDTTSDVTIDGGTVREHLNVSFIGIEFASMDASGMTHLHLDVWTPDVDSLLVKLVDFGGDGFGGGNDTEGAVTFDSGTTPALAQGSWVSLDIPLADFQAAGLASLTDLNQIVLDVGPDGTALYVDNLYFYNDGGSGGGGGGTAPATSAPTPMQDAADVMSLFSDAYADASSTWPTPWSVPNDTTSDVTIDGGTVREHLNVSFIGIEFASMDASGMTHLHLDVWTPDVDSLLVKLVDFGGDGFGGGNDTEGAVTFDSGTTPALAQGSWVSLDIPLADFQAAGLASLTDLNQIVLDVGPDGTALYVDNLYFYNDGGSGGGGGTNLAVNGDFETGDFTGWQQAINSGAQSISMDTPTNGGSFSAALSGNTAPGNGGTTEIKQANLGAGTLALGDVLTISFDVKGTFGPGGQLNVLSFTEFSGGGADLSNQTVIAGGVDDWTNFTYDVTLSGSDAGGGFSLAFNPVCGAVAGCVADVFVDNVSIVAGSGGGSGGGGGTAPATSAPTPMQDAADVMSLFSDAYADASSTWPTPWSVPNDTTSDVTIDGGTVREHLNVSFIGIEFASMDASGMTHLHLDVWTPDVDSLLVKLVDFGGDGFGGGNDTEGAVTFDSGTTPALAQGSWVSLDIPLADFQAAGLASLTDLNQIVLDVGPDGTALYVDNLYFYNDGGSGGGGGGTAPATSAPTPMQDAADVMSLFSDAYADASSTWPTPWSVPNDTTSDVTIDGGTVREHLNVSFIGIEFASMDASGMTHLHLDVWTPDVDSLLVKLVDFGGDGFGGGNDTEGAVTFDSGTTPALAQGSWVSLDIPLADFQAAGLASLTDLNQIVLDVGPDGTALYVDNLYFYNDGGSGGGGGGTAPATSAPTPMQDAADVMSLFSDAYADASSTWPTPWSVPNDTTSDVTIDGGTVREHLNVSFIGIEFASMDASGMTHLHLDVWTPDVDSLLVKLVDFGGDGFGGGNDTEGAVTFDSGTTPALAQGSWVSLDIPLADFQAAGLASLTDLNQIVLDVGPDGTALYVDNLYFYNDGGSGGGGGGTAPATSAPTPMQDAADVMSLFSDAYADASSTWPTPWSVPNDTTSDVTIDGGTVREHLNVSFIGIEFASMDASGMTHLHLDVWTPDVDSLLVKLVDFGGDGFGGGNDTEGAVTFDSGTTPALAQGSWVSLDIPLADFQAAGLASLTDLNQIVLDVGPDGTALYVDNLYFYNDGGSGGGGGGTAPATSAPTPMQDAADVMSLFSDAYADASSTWPTPWSVPNDTTSDVTIDGGTVREHLNVSFIGIEFASMDASGMTHLHLDVWTPDVDSLLVKLVDFGGDGFGGGNDTEGAVTFDSGTTPALAQGSWVSLDIPLADFQAAGLASLTDLNQIVLDVGPDGTALYVDNLYFYNDGGSGGGGGGTAPATSAPTPMQDAADVMSLFSDAYADASSTWPTPWSVPNDTTSDVTIDGGTVREHLNVSFIGIEFASMDASGMTHLHLDVWTPDVDSLLVKLVDFGGDGFGGGNDTEGAVTFDSGTTPALAQGSWVSLDIPLADFQAAGLASLTDLNQIVLDVGPDGTALYVDNLYFYNDGGSGGGGGGTAPATSAPTPMQDAADVMSLFSDAYADASSTWPTPWSVPNDTTSDVTIDGGTVREHLNVSFIGIEFASMDASGMTHLHLDVWTPDVDSLLVKLVDFGGDGFGGGNDTEGAVTFDSGTTPALAQGSWVSLDIPLADFQAAGLASLTDLNQIVLDVGPDGTALYVDNLYFYNDGGSGGGGGTNLAVNGDFETGDFTGWQQAINSGAQSISMDTPTNGGSFSAALSGNTAPGNGGTTEIKQANLGAGTLALGDVLTISFDVKGTFGPGGQLNVLSFTEFSGGGADLSNQTVIAGGVDDWTNFTYDVTLSGSDAGGGFSLAFNPVCGAVAGCVADVFVDNVSIVTN